MTVFASTASSHDSLAFKFPLSLSSYGEHPNFTVLETLYHRMRLEPFNLFSLIIFICAITHTFFAHKFRQISKKLADKHQKKIKQKAYIQASKSFELEKHDDKSFVSELFYFLGEVELIFGIWVIPLIIGIFFFHNWPTAVNYISTRNFTEPMFVIVIMALSATKPILKLAESFLKIIADRLGKSSPQAWWLSISIFAPLFGSLITEPGAMTIGALLLGKFFYQYQPSKAFSYATLGLLFVNTSVGGILTNFASPPVLMVATPWDWSTHFMFKHFGWKAILSIITSSFLYFTIFYKEFKTLSLTAQTKKSNLPPIQKVPFWITCIHILAIIWVVFHSHYPALFVGPFVLFVGFHQATSPHQHSMNIRPPILVGYFLASLIIHGGLQAWWISPVLTQLNETSLMLGATLLTAFNDNAIITYLTTTIPNFPENFKYAIVSGAVAGGGLTVIANAPNPAGQVILSKYFENGISPIYLFLSALAPTVITCVIFYTFH